MSSRIDAIFARLKKEKRAALIAFIMGGDPSMESSLAALQSLPEAGADIIELGIPFSDPMADGPSIQAAGLRALKAGATLKKILAMAAEFRQTDNDTPLLLMGYYNSLYHYGLEAFARDAAKSGVDGVIIVDVPWEEEDECKPLLMQHGIEMIRLIAPTTGDARLPLLLNEAKGFVYFIAVAGITGTRSASAGDLAAPLGKIRRHTQTPVAVGFGIKTPEQAREVAGHADAVVVGSAIVNAMAKAENGAAKAAQEFVESLARALRSGTRKAG